LYATFGGDWRVTVSNDDVEKEYNEQDNKCSHPVFEFMIRCHKKFLNLWRSQANKITNYREVDHNSVE
tara:strand:+ start:86 stop:289 length:204 start_codon:yes stop_codon:yes gene_type:complete